MQAGLFSATVTAFTIESYKWLQEDPNDVSMRLLTFLAAHVTNATIPPELTSPPFRVTPSQIRINVAWFLSLTLCLTTVLIGILCLQWLREYQRDAALPHKDAVALRQMRYEGLLYWKVPQILAALPVLLQSSLFLFFVGILDLLWTRHTAVAACISSACGLIAIFIASTTAMPALQHAFCSDPHMRVPQCPYKSPQSWIFYRSTHLLFLFLNSLNIQWSISESPRFLRHLKSITDFDWLTFDVRWRQFRDAQEISRATARNLADSKDIIHGVQWINANYSQNVEAVYPIHHSMKDLDISAAASTISGFYQDGQIDNATLRVMLDDRFSPTDYQKRDILSAYYLHLHQDTHAVLKISYIENVIRILNSQDVPQPFYDWLSEILQDLWAASPSSAQSSASDMLLDPELNVQVLLCVKTIISRRHGLKTLDIVVAWALLHRLLAPSFSGGAAQEDTGVAAAHLSVGHLRLACGLFEELEDWVRAGKEIERWERVKLCAEGMMTVFGHALDLDLNVGWLHGVCPEMVRAQSLVLALSFHMQNLGGVGEVLVRKGWCLEYWEGYKEADWEWLMKVFQFLPVEDSELSLSLHTMDCYFDLYTIDYSYVD